MKRYFITAMFLTLFSTAIFAAAAGISPILSLEGVTADNARSLLAKAWTMPGGKLLRQKFSQKTFEGRLKQIATFGLYRPYKPGYIRHIFGRWGTDDWILPIEREGFHSFYAVEVILKLLKNPTIDVFEAASSIDEFSKQSAIYAVALIYKFAVRNSMNYPELPQKNYLGFFGMMNSWDFHGSYEIDNYKRQISFFIDWQNKTFTAEQTSVTFKELSDGSFASEKLHDGEPVFSFKLIDEGKRLLIVMNHFGGNSRKFKMSGIKFYPVEVNDSRTHVFRPLSQAELDYACL